MKKRSKYRPKPILLNAHQRVLDKFQPFTEEQLLQLDAPLRISFAALKDGSAVPRDVHDIVAALNTTLVRSRTIHPVCVEAATEALEAIKRLWERFEAKGTLGLDGPGIQALGVGLDLHAELCRKSDPLQMVNALKEVMK